MPELAARAPVRHEPRPPTSPGARQPAAMALDSSPRQVAQRRLIASCFGPTAVVQLVGHKPRVGDTIRYPAKGPKDGDAYTVKEAYDGGYMLIVHDVSKKMRADVEWTSDDVWLVYQPDPKDVDMRMKTTDWDALTPLQKTGVYDRAKTAALAKILAAANSGMINATTRGRLPREVTLDVFAKQRDGEWQFVWDEMNGRQWQFTIDMDKPLDESWQEPHVGWEVKLLAPGANGSGKAYEGFAKQQGHVWLNDVPEHRQ